MNHEFQKDIVLSPIFSENMMKKKSMKLFLRKSLKHEKVSDSNQNLALNV